MLAHVSRVAPLDRPMLVVGERGTGKELVAARLNYLSPRWDKPFVKLNCAALAEGLLDSELFGHEAGAFTGALRRRLSRFELADGGTLFLDEIATCFAGGAGKAAARHRIRQLRARRRQRRAARRRARHRGDQSRPAEPGGLGEVPCRPSRPPRLRRRHHPAAARAPGDIALLAEHFAPDDEPRARRDGFAGFTARRRPRSPPIPGRAMSASCATSSSAPSTAPSPAPGRRSARSTTSPSTPSPRRSARRRRRRRRPLRRRRRPGDFPSRIRAYEAALLREALAACRFNQRRTAKALGLTYDQLRHYLKKHGIAARP